MLAEIANISLAFFEGFALIISPCILPILPIMLSGSLTGSKIRPLGIIFGFIVTFTLVTLFSRGVIEFAHINHNTIRNLSFALLLLIGLIMLSSTLTEKFNAVTSRLVNVGNKLQSANDTQGGFLGGMIFGGLVGIIWTPCAGPLLAAVIVQVVIQKTTWASILTVIAFAIGAGLPMLLIALLGRRMMSHFHFFRDHAVALRKLLGLIIIVTVLILIYDSGVSFSLGKTNNNQTTGTTLINRLEQPYPAPDIAGIDAWINSSPLQLSQLKGKVVLIDFWTYSCINCIRTLPYLKDWYAKYHDQGLEIIGIHSPEFAFERDLNNVKMAVAKFGILYPVALDNQFATWQNFHNEYWPAHYLINKEGNIVYKHFGEGEYDVTENNIRFLLGLNASNIKTPAEENDASLQTPETYLGYARAANYLGSTPVTQNLSAMYHYPENLPLNKWALQGNWIVYADKIVADSAGASIKLHFSAGKVYAVMGISQNPVVVKLTLDGKSLADEKGSDVTDDQITVTHNQLFTLLELKKEGQGILELTATHAGLEIYTFTFGQ